MRLRPVPGPRGGRAHARGHARELRLERRIHARGHRHHRGEVQRGCRALLHDVTRLARVGRHHQSFEAQVGELVVDAAVIGILHLQHPAQVPPGFVEQVGHGVPAFRNRQLAAAEEIREVLPCRHQRVQGDRRVDHVLVVVAGVVPASRCREQRAGRARGCRGGRMHLHLRVGMACGPRVAPCVRGLQRRARAVEVVGLERGVGQRRIRLRGHQQRIAGRPAFDMHPVAARRQRTEIGDGSVASGRRPRPRWRERSFQHDLVAAVHRDLEAATCGAVHEYQLGRGGMEAELVETRLRPACINRPGRIGEDGDGGREGQRRSEDQSRWRVHVPMLAEMAVPCKQVFSRPVRLGRPEPPQPNLRCCIQHFPATPLLMASVPGADATTVQASAKPGSQATGQGGESRSVSLTVQNMYDKNQSVVE